MCPLMASKRTIIGIYLRACRPHMGLMLGSLIGFGFGALCSTTFSSVLFSRIIDVLSDPTLTREAAFEKMLVPFWLLAANYMAFNIGYRIGDVSLTWGQAKVLRDLTAYAFTAVRTQSLTFFENEFAGSLVAKSRRFVRSFETLQDRFIFGFFMLSIHLIGSTFALLWQSHLIGFIFLAWVIVYVIVTYFLMAWREQTDFDESEQDSKVTGVLSDVLTNIRAVQATAMGAIEDRRFGQVVYTEWLTRRRAWNRHTIVYAVQAVLVISLEVPMIYLSLVLWRNGEIDVGGLVLVHSLLVACTRHIWDLGRAMKDVAKALTNASEFVDVAERTSEIRDTGTEELHDATGDVRFENVSFSYIPERVVIPNLSLRLSPGEKVGVVGRSGAGKTTLTKLLLRFVDPTDGAITVDGVDVRALRLDALRQSVGYVPQDPMLFHRSLRDNIAYAVPDATQEQIESAAKKAHIHDVIMRLPKSYDTFVGERGVKLSGGERQRILLARVFLQDPVVLLLDEPTSALDSESERVVQEHLQDLMKGRTTLAIAHRISTVRAMDRIIVLDQGKILEEGTHDSLLAKKGFYADLWGHQVNGFLPEDEEAQ